MCTAGQRVSLTITGPGPSFFHFPYCFSRFFTYSSFSFRTYSFPSLQDPCTHDPMCRTGSKFCQSLSRLSLLFLVATERLYMSVSVARFLFGLLGATHVAYTALFHSVYIKSSSLFSVLAFLPSPFFRFLQKYIRLCLSFLPSSLSAGESKRMSAFFRRGKSEVFLKKKIKIHKQT